MKEKGLIEAVLTFVGVVVGAGILGLPYAFSKVGVLTGLLVMLIFTVILGFSYLIVGEVCQRTIGKHQLVGLVEKYLGKKWKFIMAITIITSLYGALVAYSIAAGDILGSFFGGSLVIYSILFAVILSLLLFFKLKVIAEVESFVSILKIVFCLIIGIYLFKDFNLGNILQFDIGNIIYPVGVVMFALSGISVIPIMNLELKNKREFRKAIWIGMLISVFVYALFAISLVGVMGENTPEIATIGLASQGYAFFVVLNIFALLALATAFIGLGLALKEIYTFDFKILDYKAWILLFVITLILVILNPASFIKLLGITGSLSAGVSLIIMYYTHSVARKRSDLQPSYRMENYLIFKIILSLLFLLILINEIFGLFVL